MEVLKKISLITSLVEPMLVPLNTWPSSNIRNAFIQSPFLIFIVSITYFFLNLQDCITVKWFFQPYEELKIIKFAPKNFLYCQISNLKILRLISIRIVKGYSQPPQGTYLILVNSEIVCFEATVKKIKKISKNLLTFIHVSVIINEQSRESD